MIPFNPDLIIEVTGACNRACVGCYAPNVVSNESAISLYEKRPELFLGIVSLNNALNEFDRFPYLTTIRGGEPTLHPKLSTILLMTSRHSDQVMLETHGRWLLPESISGYKELLESIKTNKIIVKLSFDKMHGMKKEELQRITDFLSWHLIDFKVAITEPTLADFVVTRSLCSWVDDEKIIYQPKAEKADELIQPLLGTINIRGEVKKSLTNKFTTESRVGAAIA